jgi:hypothetical protein
MIESPLAAVRRIPWLPAALALIVSLLLPHTARAEEGIVRYGVSAQELQTDFFDGYGDDGYRPVRLTGYRGGNAVRYFTRWIQNNGQTWRAYYGLTGDGYHDKFVELRDLGYRPIDVSGYNTPNGVRYAVIWVRNTSGVVWRAYRDVTRDGMQDLVDTLGSDGWRPRRVEAYVIDGASRYISLWEYAPSEGFRMHNKMTRAQYQSRLDTYQPQGYALVHLDAHTVDGDVYYAGI